MWPTASSVRNSSAGLRIEVLRKAFRAAAMYPIWDFGTEEQKQRYLPSIHSGS